MDPLEQFSSDHPSVISSNVIESELGYSSSFEIRFDSKLPEGAKDPAFLKRVDEFNTWLLGHDEVSKVVGINYILKSLNKALHENRDEFHSLPNSKREVAESLMLYQMGLPEAVILTT